MQRHYLLSLILGAAFLAALFIPSQTLHAQERRVWRLVERFDNPDPFFQDCDCSDSLHCVISAIGTFGGDSFIIGTSDGGRSWSKVYVDTGKNDRRVFPLLFGETSYPSPTLAIVTADSGFILRSIDAGRTWKEHQIITIPNGKAVTAGPISMLDSQYGVLAWKWPRFDSNGVTEFLMTTTDGGLTWDTMQTSPILPEWIERNPVINSVAYFAPNNFVCVITDYGSLFNIASTADGGKTWAYAENPVEGESTIQRTHFSFPDPGHGFLTGYDFKNGRKSFVAATRDSGRTWELLHHDSIDGSFGGMNSSSFLDSVTGLASGGGSIFLTTNGGRTWERDSIEFQPATAITLAWARWLTPKRAIAAIGSGEIFIWDGTSSSVATPQRVNMEAVLQVFPNPLHSGSLLQIKAPIFERGILYTTLYSPLGHPVIEHQEHLSAPGIYEARLDLGNLPSGSYLLQISIDGVTQSQPIVLVR